MQNYFGGWPGADRASGQLKFRNAKGLVFAGNYLQGISFNARPYDNVDDAWLIMQDYPPDRHRVWRDAWCRADG